MEDTKHGIVQTHGSLYFSLTTRSVREMQPAHYTLRIESCSTLSRILLGKEVDHYESTDFETGGYKWRLVLHPNGNKKENVDDHVSLYLKISETNDLPLGWEVHAIVNFLVHDQVRDKYLCIHDGRMRRFHSMKKQWGISRLLSLGTLNDQSNGYLIDDICIFGVEVFVPKIQGNGQCVSFIKKPNCGNYSWKLDKFSRLKNTYYRSDKFTVGGYKWNLLLYPSGETSEKGKKLSLYLELSDHGAGCSISKVYVEHKLRVKDQINGNHKNYASDGIWFGSLSPSWGYRSFMPLSDLKDVKKGFLVDDTLIFEVEISLISAVNRFA